MASIAASSLHTSTPPARPVGLATTGERDGSGVSKGVSNVGIVAPIGRDNERQADALPGREQPRNDTLPGRDNHTVEAFSDRQSTASDREQSVNPNQQEAPRGQIAGGVVSGTNLTAAQEAGGEDEPETPGGLTDAEKSQVQELKARDREVRAHEAAHAATGGAFAGSPSYSYQSGPDGRQYAVGGEVSIDASPVSGDPDATVRKLSQVQAAALAPADPSSQDRRVAAAAAAGIANARAEAAALRQEELAKAFGEGEGGEDAEDAAASQASPPPPASASGAPIPQIEGVGAFEPSTETEAASSQTTGDEAVAPTGGTPAIDGPVNEADGLAPSRSGNEPQGVGEERRDLGGFGSGGRFGGDEERDENPISDFANRARAPISTPEIINISV
ncbi:MAG: hypothetical protein HOL85_04770 [Rhodospirillaceae bacterium]|nr:hypothetical protein [Rhodospirillaceae bacterium]MBT6136815.1 hypothetical protein [Rhodospirillaceae bacterium]